jgi:hypothetical protein
MDGAVIAAVAVLLADSRAGRRPPALTLMLLVAGLATSLAANIASAEPDLTARAISAWPPLALALGIEVLAGMIRRTRSAGPPAAAGLPASPASLPAASVAAIPAGRHETGLSPAERNATPGTPATVVGAQSAVPLAADNDDAAVAVVRALDGASERGQASRLEIQRALGWWGLSRRPSHRDCP